MRKNKPMKYSIIFLVLFTSCYTQQRAAHQMDRAKSEHEEIAANKCALWYPIVTVDSVTKYITNIDTIFQEGETIWVECPDSLFSKPVISNQKSGKAIPFKCPPAIIITQRDSIIVEKTKESTAKIRASNIERDKYKTKASTWQVVGLVFICISFLLGIALWFKNKR